MVAQVYKLIVINCTIKMGQKNVFLSFKSMYLKNETRELYQNIKQNSKSLA